MGSAPGLLRFASRYTRSLHDAEDAYQRAMEIALTRAPVVEPRRYMAWLHTVLRNEALAVSRARRREGPGAEADVAETCGEQVHDAVPLDALAEWRERYRAIQDGLAGLTDAQRTCLMLQAAGVSYEDIRSLTGFTLRKVERSVLEGRRSLAAWEIRLASGEACGRLDEAIDRVARGVASARERRSVGRHVRHCGPCRATLRTRRDANEWLGALVPLALIGSAPLGIADPSPAIAWWERVAGGATVRAGHMVQLALEMPSAALAKVGAGTAAVAIAGAAGGPMVVDAVAPADRGPSPIAATRVVYGAPLRSATPPTPDELGAAFARARTAAAAAAQRRDDQRARRAEQRRRARERAAAPAPAPAPARVVVAAETPDPTPAAPPAPPSPTPSAPAPAPGPGAVALEFGP